MTKKLTCSLLAPLCVIALLTGCKAPKNINYFQDKRDSSHLRIWQSYEPKIQPGDRLMIAVSGLNPESVKIYNPSAVSGATGPAGQSSGISVDVQGRILMPQLGFIKAAGLTRNALRDTLMNRLAVFLRDPVVTVDFTNFKITVLGEVNRQGPIMVPDGSITLLQALGEAGDIAPTGKRDSVMIIRESGGRRQFGYVNLLSNELFKSEYYTLQQNDVVYVQMNERKAKAETNEVFNRNLSLVTSVTAVLSTLALIIVNLAR
jgi:polysaccharide biosynthesis/export protein